ncbi:MAG: hypothetical protein H0W06_00240 [Chloroflexia bacterium]|nr:hypothetical protein [Chloroflexia bacterium]
MTQRAGWAVGILRGANVSADLPRYLINDGNIVWRVIDESRPYLFVAGGVGQHHAGASEDTHHMNIGLGQQFATWWCQPEVQHPLNHDHPRDAWADAEDLFEAM